IPTAYSRQPYSQQRSACVKCSDLRHRLAPSMILFSSHRLLCPGQMLGQLVSPAKVGGLVAQAAHSPAPWLLFDKPEFRQAYNERPFLVRHRLTEHPLFEFGALAALCRRLPAEQVKYRFGIVPGDTELDTSFHRFRGELTLDDAIEHLEEKQAYI